jgi:hypothetical protein
MHWRKAFFLALVVLVSGETTLVYGEKGLGFPTVFETSGGTKTATYEEVVQYYSNLATAYPKKMRWATVGEMTDAGFPMHTAIVSLEGDLDPSAWKSQGKLVVLINNGIHPGEPDGIDASMMLVRNVLTGMSTLPPNTVLVVIPVFNIGGMRERSAFSRVDQNGPEEFGARGNSQNLDLNRDFMKVDALETRALVGLIESVDPDLLIDNHVSNGADYQHVMTLLTTQSDKLGGPMGELLREKMDGAIYRKMRERGWDMVPYVNHWGHTPEEGWDVFLEGARFLSGYAAIRGTFAYVPETHMLKPYKDRVYATLALNEELIGLYGGMRQEVKAARDAQRAYWAKQSVVPVDWKVDSVTNAVGFKGYRSGNKPSEVSGQPRLYYDRAQPYTTKVSYASGALPVSWAWVPEVWAVSGGWNDAVERLDVHGVIKRRLKRDTVVRAEVTWVRSYSVGSQPYEGHFMLKNLVVERDTVSVTLRAGDYLVSSRQPQRRYLAEALEPTAPDGLLVWGFFNSILQQKEGYSDYVFEDTAAEWLKANPSIRADLEARKKSDPVFAANGGAQLRWVFEQSPYFETRYQRVPVFKVIPSE